MPISRNITDFTARFKGGARPNLFKVHIFFPNIAQANGFDAEGEYFFHSSSLPSWQLGTVPVGYQGRTIPFAGDRTVVPWMIMCYNEENFGLRNAFERWSEAINGVETNVALVDPVGYFATATVAHLSRKNQIIKEYTMYNIFPSEVSDIQLAWMNNDQAEEFQVSFEMSHFVTDTVVVT